MKELIEKYQNEINTSVAFRASIDDITRVKALIAIDIYKNVIKDLEQLQDKQQLSKVTDLKFKIVEEAIRQKEIVEKNSPVLLSDFVQIFTMGGLYTEQLSKVKVTDEEIENEAYKRYTPIKPPKTKEDVMYNIDCAVKLSIFLEGAKWLQSKQGK